MTEYNGCQFEHDEKVKEIHDMYMNEDIDRSKVTEEAIKMLKMEDADQDIIELRARILRLWPDEPDMEAKE